MSLLADVDVLVPNQTELATIAGHDGPVDRATAAELATRLPSSSVIVTSAPRVPSWCSTARRPMCPLPLCARSTPRQQVIRSAALADGLVRGLDLVEATRWAVRVGAATTQRPGAQPSLPTPDEVRLLIGD